MSAVVSEKSGKTMTVHTGFFFRKMTIGVAQTIMTHNITKGLNIQDLEAAVHRLVDRNPILSGNLFFGKETPGVYVETGKYDTFVHRIPAPKDIPSPTSCKSSTELTKYVQDYIEPLMPASKKGTEELAKKLPLFGIYVIQLPDGYVYYGPSLSHVIGDGRTYYMLVEELNAILNKKRMPPPIQWESKAGTVFDFTHQVTSPLFWLSMIMIIIVYAVCGFSETENIMLCKIKIDSKKKELARQGSYLSTNDIVTAAICESISQEYNYFNQSVCYRHGRWPGVGDRDAGNITRLVPFSVSLGKDPNEIRKLVDSLAANPSRDIPFWSTFLGLGYNQANWASIQQVLDGTVFHSPSHSVVVANDVPGVIIYQPNEKEIGFVHKLKNLDTSKGLLSEITV